MRIQVTFVAAIALLCLPLLSQTQLPQVKLTSDPPPITELGQASDVVAFATIDEILQPGGRASPQISVKLKITRVLKGPPLYEAVATIQAQSARGPGPSDMPAEWLGKSGIWFLHTVGDHFEIYPRNRRAYQAKDLFLPVADISPPDPLSLEHQLLVYQVRWFEQLQQPTSSDVNGFLSGFVRVKHDEIPNYVEPLLTSGSMAQHVAALLASLQADSLDALEMFINEIPTLQKDARFGDLLQAIGTYPHPKNWAEPLQRLMALYGDVPGVENAATGALLRMVPARDALPLMVRRLDSGNPNDVLGASAYLADYAMFADANGNRLDSGSPGPFYSEQTNAHRPTIKPDFPVEEYRNFWKTWWSQNQAKILRTSP